MMQNLIGLRRLRVQMSLGFMKFDFRKTTKRMLPNTQSQEQEARQLLGLWVKAQNSTTTQRILSFPVRAFFVSFPLRIMRIQLLMVIRLACLFLLAILIAQ